MEFNNVRKMASPKQMVMKVLFIAIAIYVVTSQVTGDVFKNQNISRACFGAAGLICTKNTVGCNDKGKVVLINDVVYRGTETDACAGVSDCNLFNSENICCNQEEAVTLHNDTLDSHRLKMYKTCSGQQSCQVNVPAIRLKAGRVTSTTVKYHCIKEQSMINFCDNITQSKKIIYIMYNGQQGNFLKSKCHCSFHAESVFDLYSVYIRLQKQDSASPQCTNTTLMWGYNKTENVEKCIHSGDNSTLRKLNTYNNIKDMWVQLNIRDEKPTMVWIAAKATGGKVNVTCGQRNVNTQASGNVNVTCGQRNVNTQGTRTNLSATSHNTTINTKSHNISKSDPGSTIVPGSAMSPTVSTNVHLHEPSTNTTVAAIKPDSHNTVSDDDTNIGAIVGPVIAIIIIAVLVVIGLIFLRRRRAKQQSSQSTTTRSYEGLTGSSENGSENKACAYDIISDYEISKPIVLPTGCKVANGEPVVLFASFGDSYKQADETAISDVVNDMYSDINPKDMRYNDHRRNDNSESEYNHLHGVNVCETDAQSGNVYSHLKTSLRNTSPSNDGYDHFGCNKPNSLNENNVSSLSSNDYDHLSSAKTNNATDCNQPITTHIQQATTKDATVKTSDNSNMPEVFFAATTSLQIDPSCEYAKVKRGKPVASSDYEMAGILNDVEV